MATAVYLAFSQAIECSSNSSTAQRSPTTPPLTVPESQSPIYCQSTKVLSPVFRQSLAHGMKQPDPTIYVVATIAFAVLIFMPPSPAEEEALAMLVSGNSHFP